MRYLTFLLAVLVLFSVSKDAFAGAGDYGNWCGANNTRSNRNYPVDDGIDETCRKHDLYHKCSCDGAFIRRLTKASASNEHAEAYRISAISAFLVKPCEIRHKKCVKLCNFGGCFKKCKKWSTYGTGGNSL
jgi:hypothetical protein